MIDTTVTKAQGLAQFERYLDDGVLYRVRIAQARRARSLNQNALFHAIVTKIAHASGELTDEGRLRIKEGLKEQAMAERGYPYVTYQGQTKPMPSRWANVEQMSILIDTAIDQAAELGVDCRQEWEQWQNMARELAKKEG